MTLAALFSQIIRRCYQHLLDICTFDLVPCRRWEELVVLLIQHQINSQKYREAFLLSVVTVARINCLIKAAMDIAVLN
jgi:hypothetical protein